MPRPPGARLAPSERLRNPDAMLSRTDLRELGPERLVRVADYLELLEASTYRDDRVR